MNESNAQEMAQTEGKSHSNNRVGKQNLNDNHVPIQREHIGSRVSSCFEIGGHTVTQLNI